MLKWIEFRYKVWILEGLLRVYVNKLKIIKG